MFPSGTPVAKRLFDYLLTLPGLLLAFPLMLVISLLILAVDGRPVFFRQLRPGYRGKPFTLIKFRTMRSVHGQPDADRLTAIGRFLRATSLDELPELNNVLRGEMSLIGPRPLLMQYLDRYTPEQARRHLCLPGITGWAQVNGRNNVSWEEKFKLDIWYLDHWSLWLDVQILARTLWKVITREGINPPAGATAHEFMGAPLTRSDGRDR